MFEFSLSRAIIKTKYTIILTLGAIIGVMCLIVITSLFNNYYLASENIFLGIFPHILIQKKQITALEGENIKRQLQKRFPQIEMIEPAIYKEVDAIVSKVNKKKFFCVRENDSLVCFDEKRHSGDVKIDIRYGFTIVEKKEQKILLKGITIKNNNTVAGIKKIINGRIRLNDLNQNTDENGNPIPWSFYLQQDLFPGAVGLTDFLLQLPGIDQTRYHFLQKGTLGLGTKKERFPLLVMSLKNAQQCLGGLATFNVLEVKLSSPYDCESLSIQLKKYLGPGYTVTNWIESSRASFAFLGMIKLMVLAIIFSIAIVAAIGMISTLTLIVMQNKGKIAILKSIGIKSSSIYRIFILNTGITGILGVLIGTALGYGISFLLIHQFSPSLKKLGIKDPQILISTSEILIIGIAVITLFLLTAIVPSRHAIHTDIVDGLQEQN